MFSKNKIRLDMVSSITFSSKTRLKQQALILAKGNVKEAQEIYDFLVKDLEDLPITEPIEPTRVDQIKSTIGSGYNWIKENQNDIINLVEMVKSFIGKKGAAAPVSSTTPLPPIN